MINATNSVIIPNEVIHELIQENGLSKHPYEKVVDIDRPINRLDIDVRFRCDDTFSRGKITKTTKEGITEEIKNMFLKDEKLKYYSSFISDNGYLYVTFYIENHSKCPHCYM